MTTLDTIDTMHTVRTEGGLRPVARDARATQTLPRIAVAHGDGVGAEVTQAVLDILLAAGARIDVAPIEIGEKVYREGIHSGISADAWRVIRECGVLLKGPIATPQGGGYKSLNVTLRKALGLYANVRPCVSYAPFIAHGPAGMDVVIIRENEEDVYAGIEHRQTDDVYQCLKLITRPGCERIVRYAFEFARANGRTKVSCFTKDNIMKMTDGLFHRVFTEIAAEYVDIEAEHLIVDIGAARMVTRPEAFDVIVLPNLYGDILSDIAAEMTGSIGLVGSANVGDHGALFEAIHGGAPDIAGRGDANPSGLLLAGVMMLNYLGQSEAANRVHQAWLATIEEGLHTADIADGETSTVIGTRAFTHEIVKRLGTWPKDMVSTPLVLPRPQPWSRPPMALPAQKEMVGVDVFVQWTGRDPQTLAGLLRCAGTNGLALQMISNRGVKVWPDGLPETFCVDHWRCRFVSDAGGIINHAQILGLLYNLAGADIDFIKTEHLCTFDDEAGFSYGHSQ
ncbi:MAG: NADP-dependent isocitrate dehydrogenase [Burkholderiales bacterium]